MTRQTLTVVYHGLGGFFSPISKGTRTLEKLVEAIKPGEDAKDFIQSNWRDAAAWIDSRTIPGKPKPRVIIIGHSKGCQVAIELAKWCRDNGYAVPYIAAIDPTAGYTMPVPENVHYVDEFWASSGWPAMARKWFFLSGGRYEYPHGTEHTIRRYQIGHIPIASHPPVQSIIVERCRRLLEPPKPRAKK